MQCWQTTENTWNIPIKDSLSPSRRLMPPFFFSPPAIEVDKKLEQSTKPNFLLMNKHSILSEWFYPWLLTAAPPRKFNPVHSILENLNQTNKKNLETNITSSIPSPEKASKTIESPRNSLSCSCKSNSANSLRHSPKITEKNKNDLISPIQFSPISSSFNSYLNMLQINPFISEFKSKESKSSLHCFPNQRCLFDMNFSYFQSPNQHCYSTAINPNFWEKSLDPSRLTSFALPQLSKNNENFPSGFSTQSLFSDSQIFHPPREHFPSTSTNICSIRSANGSSLASSGSLSESSSSFDRLEKTTKPSDKRSSVVLLKQTLLHQEKKQFPHRCNVSF